METNWSERRQAERRAEQREYEERREREQWREHFEQCGQRDPCPHAG